MSTSVVETKKKTGIKAAVKKTGAKAKSYAGKKVQSAKNFAGKYKKDLKKAYSIGYRMGWDDAIDVPDRVGAKSAAARGYKKGIKNRKKSDKYIGRYIDSIYY